VNSKAQNFTVGQGLVALLHWPTSTGPISIEIHIMGQRAWACQPNPQAHLFKAHVKINPRDDPHSGLLKIGDKSEHKDLYIMLIDCKWKFFELSKR
jgi:hypothetical protein